MRAGAIAIVCVMGLGCGKPSLADAPAAPRSEDVAIPSPPSSSATAVRPVATAQPTAAAEDPARPRAFAALAGQCPQGYERFSSACVHASYMRRTPLTQLMNELVDFRNGKPSPTFDPTAPLPGAPSAEALARANAEPEEPPVQKPDPTNIDPGALIATQAEIEERQRQVEERARNRGEVTAKVGGGGGASARPQAAPGQQERAATRSDDGPQTASADAPAKPSTDPTSGLSKEELAAVAEGVEKVLRAEVGEGECERARKNVQDMRDNNCSLEASSRDFCRDTLIPQAERAVAVVCAMTK